MDVFRLLSSGAKFTDKRNKEVKNLFQGKTATPLVSTVNKQNKSGNESDSDDEVSHKGGVDFSREDEVNAFRNRLRIRVKGSRIVKPCPTFQEMPIENSLKPVLLRNIEASRWKEPTPIQMQSIPVLLSGRDILAAAPTGSGKTASYVIPTLSKLAKSASKSAGGSGVRALLLSPTKELADQIFREVQRLSEGKKIRSCVLKKKILKMATDQGQQVFQKYDLLIATPLRLLTLVRANAIDLSKVEIVVLDEADRLLDLQSAPRKNDNNDEEDDDDEPENEEEGEEQGAKAGSKRERSAFLSQVDEILTQCPASGVQRALFSATLGAFVKELASVFLKDPVEVTIGAENTGASTIKQRLIFVGREDGKLLAMRQLIQEGLKPPVLIFMQSIDRAKDLFKELIYDGINVDVMHAGRSAHQREEIMKRFRAGDVWVLICTDLMARGIDFQGVQMVINYDLPVSAVNYIHRIGRTGRAGRSGEAVTFFTEEDMPRIRPIANVIKLSGCDVPDWMLQIKSLSTKHKKQLRRSAPKRRRIGIGSHDITDRRSDDEQEDESDPQPAYSNRNPGDDDVMDEDNNGNEDGGGWETAEAFNDDDDNADMDEEYAEDTYDTAGRDYENEEEEEEEENNNHSGKKRRRQSKNGRESSQTELTLRDQASFKHNRKHNKDASRMKKAQAKRHVKK